MSAHKRQLKSGVRWRYDKMLRGKRFQSPAVYLSKAQAEAAEAEVVTHYLRTGEILGPPPIGASVSVETVEELYSRWIVWLESHRSPRHAYNMRSLMARALAQAPELASLPAPELTIEQIEDWAERWAADFLERGLGRHTINDWLRYSQTAWSPPWGRRRAIRQYQFNPWAHVDRYAVSRRAKYVPAPSEVASLCAAAEADVQLYLEVMTETAARVAEARELTWQVVACDEPPYGIVLFTSKTASGDRVPRRLAIGDALASRFRSWRRQQREAKGPACKYVFQRADAPEPHGETWSLKNQRRLCKEAGLVYFPPGCYRHYRASKWAQEGVPLTTIRDRLGHSKATTTDNYLKDLLGR